MGAKQLTFDQDAREKIRAGVTKLARAVKVTYGPRGRNAVIDKGWGSPTITKDGVTVAEEVELATAPTRTWAPNSSRKPPRRRVTSPATGRPPRRCSPRPSSSRRTSSSFRRRQCVHGRSPAACARPPPRSWIQLAKMARKVVTADRTHVKHVATIAANGDREIGSMIADAMDKVGKDGVITIEEGKTLDTSGGCHPGHAVRSRLPLAALRHQPGSHGGRARASRLVLIWEDKISVRDQAHPACWSR